MNAPVIYPYNSLLEWSDTTSLTLSGSADSNTVSVSAIDNGVPATAYYNATSHEWSYETTITGYVNDFVVISEDSLSDTASATAFIEVDSPIIIDTDLIYNTLNPSLEGRTNEVTLRLEASPDANSYSPSGFVHDAFSTDFVYNNFRFYSPTQTFYFMGRDLGGGESSPEPVTLNYLMGDPLIYTEITDPYDSRTVSLAGSADHDVTGFIYSPEGGQFSSGRVETSSGGFTEWAYKFVMMEQSEEFNIKTVDVFGSESAEQQLQINYGVESPIILLPGSIKSITDDTAITGSTAEEFLTLGGDFKEDGIITSDMVLATSGKNISEYRAVTQVEDNYIVTDPFPFAWEPGDKIKIYPREDRPVMYTDQNDIDISGKCNSNIAKVRYTTEELGPVKVYAKNTQGYQIDTSNNNLVLNINGKLEFIILPSGLLSAQDIADQVNSAFSSTFDYDVAFSDGERFYIEAIHIHVFPGTADSTLGLVEGEVNFALEIEVPDVVTFQNSSVGGADCSLEVIETGLLFCMNLDGVYVRFTFSTNTEYSKNDIIDKINVFAGKEVATNIGPNIVFNATTNLWVGDSLEDLNLVEQLNGDANFNTDLNLSTDINRDPSSIESGIGGSGTVGGDEDSGQGYGGSAGVGSGDWNVNIDIIQPSNNLKIYGLSEFYELSPPVSLSVEYKIPAPAINAFASTVSTNFVDLSGTYNSSALGVTINGVAADLASSGKWVTQVLDLNLGTNYITVVAKDRFSTDSEAAAVAITYNDPSDVPFPSQEGSIPLEWKSISSPSFAPSDVLKVAETIDSIFDPIIGVLDFVSGLLDIAKAFIIDNILGPIAALRAAIQALIDNITELLDRVVNGAGLYTLSTLPDSSSIKPGKYLDAFKYIKGDFSDFFGKITASFDDPLDPNRPQLSNDSTVGGVVLAIGDGSGVGDFLKAFKSLTELYTKQKMDYGLSPVNNLKVEGQNGRNVLTWTAPDGEANIFPYEYVILRSEVSGGKVKVTQVKTQLSSEGKGNQYYPEDYYDPDTGQAEGEYEIVGRVTNYQIMKEFKFIDGTATQSEIENAEGVDKYVKGTIGFFDAARDFVLVSGGSNNTKVENGKTYYYKVVPTIGLEAEFDGDDVTWDDFLYATRGNSPEVVMAASYTHLEERTEYLSDQISTTKAGHYKLGGSIYDKDTGIFADNVNDIKVIVDGATTPAKKIYAEQGLVVLSNAPKSSLAITYWGKRTQATTRASLVSLYQGSSSVTEAGEDTVVGGFTFKDDVASNSMSIQVGKGTNITQTYGGLPLTRAQNITFARFKEGETSKTMTASQVASVIRSQTSGLKVFVDHLNRIVLEEDQNPDIFEGSYLEIKQSNSVLGFIASQDLSDYALPAISVYTAAGNSSEMDLTHTVSIAGPYGGVSPDWKSLRISDLFPAVNDLLRYINSTFDQLSKSLTSATNSIIDFIDLLQAKIEALSDMLKDAQDLLKRLAEALTIQGGFYTLVIPPNSGGTTYFKEAITTSIGYPPDSEYTGGIVFLYTDGGTGVALDWIMSSLS